MSQHKIPSGTPNMLVTNMQLALVISLKVKQMRTLPPSRETSSKNAVMFSPSHRLSRSRQKEEEGHRHIC